MESDKFYKYQIFKVSSEKYDKSVDQLTEEESKDVLRICQRKLRIEEAVLLSDEASKVVLQSAELDKSLKEIKRRYEDDISFSMGLENACLTEEEFSEALFRELYVNSILNYVSSNCDPVSDVDVSLFYFMNLEKFKRPEIRIARHILVTVNEENPENVRNESLKKISSIESRLKKKPSRFEEQALKHSECPTSLQGGLLGEVRKGVLFPELEEKLFKINEGELSGVVESELGFHILRCDEVKSAGPAALDEVSTRLKEHLVNRNRDQKQRQWLEGLLKKTNRDDTYEEIANG